MNADHVVRTATVDGLRRLHASIMDGNDPSSFELMSLAAAITLLDIVDVDFGGADDPRFPGTPMQPGKTTLHDEQRPSKTATPPANACTDGKRHKYGDDRSCKKCGAADPRAPRPDTRTAEIPGVTP